MIGTLFETPRNMKAISSVVMIAPPMAATWVTDNRVSVRATGLRTGRPVLSLPPEANASGTWIWTSSAGLSGTVMTDLHLGQGPFLPVLGADVAA